MTSTPWNGNSRGGGGVGDVGGLKQKCLRGKMYIFWNYTLDAQDFYVPTLP